MLNGNQLCREGETMVQDKSLFYYGALYNRIIDGKLEEARQTIIDLIPQGSSVIDIGCGTGELCFELFRQKQCKAVGLDLSLKMIRFAQERNTFPEVTFVHGDATNLSEYPDRSFDFAVMLVFIHEMDEEKQRKALNEALRVANKLIICDSAAPLPKNKGGFLIWLAETLFGYEHKEHQKRFLKQGGIEGLLKALNLDVKIEHSQKFWYDARQIVVISKNEA